MLSISTPAILFPAISLLMLAYTNRFLALSQLIRSLHHDYLNQELSKTLLQIQHLRKRVLLIRMMQAFGALSIMLCLLSIFLLLVSYSLFGTVMFVLSLLVFFLSILFSFIEILLSSNALNILLSDIENR
ncbi:MAG: DUF2721 domain-containing protein [Candidatus Margulisiibacteriota bacterium]